MSNLFEIPLSPTPQQFVIQLGTTTYQLTFKWNELMACWVMDMMDSSGTAPILMGVPMVTGDDLFGQFGYLSLGGELLAQTDQNLAAPPTFSNLGTAGHVYFRTEP